MTGALPAWGEYKLNEQYPPWPMRPCADFGAFACFHANGQQELISSEGMMVCDPSTEMWIPCPACVVIGDISSC